MKQDYSKALELAKDQIVDINNFNSTKSNDIIKFKCCSCNEIKTCIKKQFAWSILNSQHHKKYCSNKCQGKTLYNSVTFNCEVCGKETIRQNNNTKRSKNHFCGSKCSAIFTNQKRKEKGEFHSLETKKKLSESLYKRNLDRYRQEIENGMRDAKTMQKFYKNNCIMCNKEFLARREKLTCSEVCYKERLKITGHKGGTITASLPYHIKNRSKNEKLFYEMIKSKFNDALPNQRIFNGFDADIVIPSLKLAIHWNGVWHYKQIFNTSKGKYQFEQIQSRDKQRLNEIEKCGFSNYIVKDMNGYNPNFVKTEFESFVNNLSITQS